MSKQPSKASGLKIKNVSTRLNRISCLVLRPGQSGGVDPKDAGAVRRSALIGVELVEVLPDAPPPPMPSVLGKLTEDQAVARVKDETDPEILAGLLEAEKRPAVVQAIQDRAKTLGV